MSKSRNSYVYSSPFGYFNAHNCLLPRKRLKVHVIAKEVIRICIYSGVKVFAPFCSLLCPTIFNAVELSAFTIYLVNEICGQSLSHDVQKEMNRCDIDLFLTVAALFSPSVTFDSIMEFIETKRPDFTNLTYFGKEVYNLITSLFNCYADDLSDQDQMIINWIDLDLNTSIILDFEQKDVHVNDYNLFEDCQYERRDEY